MIFYGVIPLERDKVTLYEMWVGIALTDIVIALTGIWFVKEPVKCLLGLLLGAVTAVVISYNMLISIRKSVDRGGDNRLYMGSAAIIRVLIEIVVLVVAHFSPYTDLIWCFLGIFSLKPGTYLVPFIHKLALKWGITKDIEYPVAEMENDVKNVDDRADINSNLVNDITNIL